MVSRFYEHAFEHAAEALQRAPRQSEPFEWVHVQNVFPADYYAALLANKPALADYQRLAETGRVMGGMGDYSPERYVLDSITDRVQQLPVPTRRFWSGTFEALDSGMMARACVDAFAAVIASRFPASANGDADLELSWSSLLVRDRGRYILAPHADHPSKLVSLLFYLPDSPRASHLGTTLYRLKDGVEALPDDGGAYDFSLFEAVHSVPFTPNSLFAFAKTPTSYHGVEPVPDAQERDLLLFNVRGAPRGTG